MLVKIYEENPNPKDVSKVVKTLQDGGLVIYPTDTVYAIGNMPDERGESAKEQPLHHLL